VIAPLALALAVLAADAPSAGGAAGARDVIDAARASARGDSTLATPPPAGRSVPSHDTTEATSRAGAPDTSVRVPGLPLRFGWSDARVATLGWRLGRGGRTGPCRWFGVPGEAVARFENGALSRVHLDLREASEHDAAYVQDQLTRAGLRRFCDGTGPGTQTCEWNGAAVRVTATFTAGLVAADIEGRMPAAAAAAAPHDAPAARAPSGLGAAASPPVDRPGAAAETLEVADARHPDAVHAVAIARPAAPVYPAAARAAGVAGRVWVIALVDTGGAVVEASVVRGIPELNAAALAAVRGMAFVPVRREGRPVSFHVRVPLLFTLR
jgi:TonB family protein